MIGRLDIVEVVKDAIRGFNAPPALLPGSWIAEQPGVMQMMDAFCAKAGEVGYRCVSEFESIICIFLFYHTDLGTHCLFVHFHT